jgi:DamX protein
LGGYLSRDVKADDGAMAPAAADVVQSEYKDTAWLWSQNPTRYTIQLAGGEDEAALEALMKRLDLAADLAVAETLHQGRPWYVLLYGSYANRETAERAVSQLPLSLKSSGPWLRRFSVIQGENSLAAQRH